MEKDTGIETSIEPSDTSRIVDNNLVDESTTNENVIISKKELRKKKRLERIKKRFDYENDISFRGPLSYRYLRIIAWIATAIMIFVKVANACNILLIPEKALLQGNAEYILEFISETSIPLFIIATYSTLLNRSKSFKNILFFYIFMYVVVALGAIILYQHYVVSVLNALEISDETKLTIRNSLAKKVHFNVFADLVALSLFNMCMNYTPKKHFQGNKLIYFRLLGILPILIAFIGYFVKVGESLELLEAPFALCVFLPTKPPLMYAVFITLTIMIKIRENKFYKLGKSEEDYKKYLKSNRNSLSFSIMLSIVLAIVSVLDFTLLMTALLSSNLPLLLSIIYLDIGSCSFLIFTIPFVMLFSYTRVYRDSKWDLLILLMGLGMCMFAIIETIYRAILAFFAH